MRILMIILGLIFGSLGSVVMTRFSDGVTRTKLRGFFFGRSQCPDCKHALKAKNLIPVVSYLVQGGKCEYCKKKISRIYPVLEILCGGIFLITYIFLKDFGTTILIFGLLTNRLLILLLVYDFYLQKYELHMIARILLATVGIVANIFAPGGNLRFAFLSTLPFGGFFTGIYFFAKRYVKIRFKKDMEGFGEGDIYLAATIGLFIPIIFTFQGITFSLWMLTNVLILFVLLSSILGLLRGLVQYIENLKIAILHLHFTILKFKFGKKSTIGTNSKFNIQHSTLYSIPFFPAMIIAFRIMAWKLPYFISLLFG